MKIDLDTISPKYRARYESLYEKHRRLDAKIGGLSTHSVKRILDAAEITVLKIRKLRVKDQLDAFIAQPGFFTAPPAAAPAQKPHLVIVNTSVPKTKSYAKPMPRLRGVTHTGVALAAL